MKPERSIKRRILGDCAAAMLPAVAVYALGDLAAYCLSVFSAGELGSFFDAVLALDLSRAMGRFWILLAALLASTLAVPAFVMGGEILMFARTLTHDRMCMGHYLRKKFESAHSLSAGEARERLENDPIELRNDWVNLAEKSILVPATLAYLLVRSLHASPLYTLLTLGILAAKLLLPFLLRKTNAALLLRDREYRSAVEATETQVSQQAHAVRLFGLKSALIGRLDELFKAHYAKTIKKSALYKAVEEKTLSWLDTFCYLCILLAGAWLLSRGRIAAGAILAMMGFFDVFDLIAADTGEVIKLIPKLRTDLERMALFYTDPEPDGAATDGFRVLTVENASFSRDEKPIFSALDFTLRSGERLAVTGPNGSGNRRCCASSAVCRRGIPAASPSTAPTCAASPPPPGGGSSASWSRTRICSRAPSSKTSASAASPRRTRRSWPSWSGWRSPIWPSGTSLTAAEACPAASGSASPSPGRC